MAGEEIRQQEEQVQEQEKNEMPDEGIVTTEEELEGFRIVKAILCQKLAPERIIHRDSKSYFAILLDDNARKPLCRLYFNSAKKKYIGLFNDLANFQGGAKNDVRVEIETINDIYKHQAELLQTVEYYENPPTPVAEPQSTNTAIAPTAEIPEI